ncbi:MAG TPA: hypothetical protein VI873_01505 [Candidatus Peribacteraceae bacterium]|nr:hypothetical protein [Candidatus Peribacteraceae bacterium]
MKKFVSLVAAGIISMSVVAPALARKVSDVEGGAASEKVRTLKKTKQILERMTEQARSGNSGRQLGRAMNSECKTRRALARAECAHQFNKTKNLGQKIKFMRVKPKPVASSSSSSAASTTSSSTSSAGSSSSASSN